MGGGALDPAQRPPAGCRWSFTPRRREGWATWAMPAGARELAVDPLLAGGGSVQPAINGQAEALALAQPSAGGEDDERTIATAAWRRRAPRQLPPRAGRSRHGPAWGSLIRRQGDDSDEAVADGRLEDRRHPAVDELDRAGGEDAAAVLHPGLDLAPADGRRSAGRRGSGRRGSGGTSRTGSPWTSGASGPPATPRRRPGTACGRWPGRCRCRGPGRRARRRGSVGRRPCGRSDGSAGARRGTPASGPDSVRWAVGRCSPCAPHLASAATERPRSSASPQTVLRI